MLEHPGYCPMMYRLFNMGINDWGMPDRPPNSAPANINFHYTTCMGNKLLKYIYDLEDKVGVRATLHPNDFQTTKGQDHCLLAFTE
jgi:hypothetical protein